MASLHGPIICAVVRAKRIGLCSVPVHTPLLKAKLIRSGIWGIKVLNSGTTNVGYCHRSKDCYTIQCSFSSSSNGNGGSKAGNFSANEAEYVNSSVVEAVEVGSGPEGFMVKMRDGKHLWCTHNNPQGGHLPNYASNRVEDGRWDRNSTPHHRFGDA